MCTSFDFLCTFRFQANQTCIPPNKSARSQQWETRNRPSDLNEACFAVKGSLIRTAPRQTMKYKQMLKIRKVEKDPQVRDRMVSHFVFGKNTRSFGNYGIWKLSMSNKLNSLGRALPIRAAIELSNAMNMILPRIP